ncbi:MAG: transcription termination/antitermination protein NusG [Nitrospirae bacterium]|nr:transcription termination/antitermination protein NusG [Nitrospirota bacterium]
MEGKKWYLVHTLSGYETVAKSCLEDRIKASGLAQYFEQILIPSQEVTESKRGKAKTVRRPVFSGYILVRMDLNEKTWHLVRGTPRVTGFVGGNKTPAIIPDHEVEDLSRQIQDGTLKMKPGTTLEKGDHIRVTSGPFVGFSGVVDELNVDRKTVKVIFSIFGRPTPVELDMDQVERD